MVRREPRERMRCQLPLNNQLSHELTEWESLITTRMTPSHSWGTSFPGSVALLMQTMVSPLGRFYLHRNVLIRDCCSYILLVWPWALFDLILLDQVHGRLSFLSTLHWFCSAFYMPVVLNTATLNLFSKNILSVIYHKIAHWPELGYLQSALSRSQLLL